MEIKKEDKQPWKKPLQFYHAYGSGENKTQKNVLSTIVVLKQIFHLWRAPAKTASIVFLISL